MKTCEIVSGGKAREREASQGCAVEQVLATPVHVGFCSQETLLASHKHTQGGPALLGPYGVLAHIIRSLPTLTTLDEFHKGCGTHSAS